jgi:hypothetical protein
MGHVIGKRRYARETYPETGGAAGEAGLARNSALGPAGSPVFITGAGVQIPWSTIDVGAPGVEVPITPQSTGIIRITAMVGVENVTDDVVATPVTVQLDGLGPVAVFASATVLPDESAEIPFTIDLWGAHALPVGVTTNISLLVKFVGAAETVQLDLNRSSIDIQELPAATG